MKPVVIHPEAEREMLAAALFYDERSAGLGSLFLDEVERGFRLIAERPEAWTNISPTVHRCLLSEFPFGIIYRNHIMLQSRCKPIYRLGRLFLFVDEDLPFIEGKHFI
jgi:hypothetical protein